MEEVEEEEEQAEGEDEEDEDEMEGKRSTKSFVLCLTSYAQRKI